MLINIVGAAGYTGGELLRLLLSHPLAPTIVPVSRSSDATAVASLHKDLCGITDLAFAGKPVDNADVLFLCLPHGSAAQWLAEHEQSHSTVVIDLSADHRRNPNWTYGLPEMNAESILNSRRIANPGCFATCATLANLPLSTSNLIEGNLSITGITGSTGAGKGLSETSNFSWRASNVEVYNPFIHRHTEEIERNLNGRHIEFIPMRGPWSRGIMTTCLSTVSSEKSDRLAEIYKLFYADKPLTHFCDDLPDMKRVVGTCRAMVGITTYGDRCLAVCVLDNLLKGAAGQAIQNMNLALGIVETLGLTGKGIAY